VSLLIVSTFLVLGFAPAPFPRPVKTEANRTALARMQGIWVVTWMEENGESIARIEGKPVGGYRLTIAGNRATLGTIGERQPTRFIIHIDATRKPKALDLKYDDDDRLEAIYSLGGDTLVICGTKSKDRRPAEFTTKEGYAIAVFRRQKP
jgi:uncharacterized protein (TIGR03067 family)